MQHAEFRRLFGANPKRTEPELLAHRAGCADCARYAADLERLDTLVAGALEVPAPSNYRQPWELEAAAPARARVLTRSPARWYALAASLLLVISLGAGAWLHQRRDALFEEVVKHADRERDVMVVSDKRVNDEKVRTTLAKAGARLNASLPVSTARTCKIRGVIAPHLIMQTPDGPVQVLLLTEQRVLLSHSARKRGYQAELVPVDGHSIAVVGSSEAAVASGARMARDAIEWAP